MVLVSGSVMREEAILLCQQYTESGAEEKDDLHVICWWSGEGESLMFMLPLCSVWE
jgi:hypothetical protein